MSISRTVCVTLGAVVAVVAVGAAPDRAVVVVAAPAFTVALVVDVTTPLAVGVVAGAGGVVVSPRRVCARALEGRHHLLPALLFLFHAAPVDALQPASV